MSAPGPTVTAVGRPDDGDDPAAPWRPAGGGPAVLVVLVLAVLAVGLWHVTQGTSGVGAAGLLRAVTGGGGEIGGVPISDVLLGSRLPRVLAGVGVGVALGVAGVLLQSVTRNPLAAPDTLAVTAGSYFALCLVAALQLTVPFWASGGVAVLGGLAAAALVLSLVGRSAGTGTTRLILAGSAVAMALDAGAAMLLILFRQQTAGLYAWGNGSLAQLDLDASLRAVPVVVLVLGIALLAARRLDVLRLGDETASTLGVPLRSTRMTAIACAVVLTSVSVTIAGPLAFVGLGAPVLARLIATRVRGVHRHVLLIPVAGLLGALLVLLADAGLRALVGAGGAASVPTGVPTALLGGLLIVVLALRLRDSRTVVEARARIPIRSSRRALVVLVVTGALVVGTAVVGLLAGSLWLRTGDIALWLQGAAPDLVGRALDERAPRVAAALVAGAALALAGAVVQSTVRNPLAEPGLLGITAGAGLGAVVVVTALPGSGRTLLVVAAVVAGLAAFALVALLTRRGGLSPDRFVLVGIGCAYALDAVSTYLLLRGDPGQTPRILTWLSGTTYGRTAGDVVPVVIVLLLAIPLLVGLRRRLDLLAVDEDTPRVLGIRPERTRPLVLTVAAVLAAVAVVAVGVVGFVGLVAPHLARALVGARHARVVPVAMLLGAVLTGLADVLGRALLPPTELPTGLVLAVLGAPYFVWLMRRSRA